MATWTIIADSVLAAGKAIKSTTMKALRDNITAHAEGASGAPKHVQASLSTATQSLAGSIYNGLSMDLTLDAYMFFPMFHAQNNGILLAGHSVDGAGADNVRCSLYNRHAASRTYDLDYRYIAVA